MSPVSEPWRMRCPNGHSSWTSEGTNYWCEVCGDTFDQLHDWKEEGHDE